MLLFTTVSIYFAIGLVHTEINAHCDSFLFSFQIFIGFVIKQFEYMEEGQVK